MSRKLIIIALTFFALAGAPASAAHFKVGYAERDITPTEPMPMWGYGARHAQLSVGVMDPLFARALVIDVGTNKLAIVGLDMGRGPRESSMKIIREAVNAASGVNMLMISGSHTHHGPVTELTDGDGFGKGKFDAAVAYSAQFEQGIIDAINEAATGVRDAKYGWGSREIEMNRNRHTKIEPKPTDPELSVVRFDDLDGGIIALLVNFSAHPTMLPSVKMEYSADYPGAMIGAVNEALGTHAFFMQGAAGNMSTRTTEETRDHVSFGRALGGHVVEIAREIETRVPEHPAIMSRVDEFEFKSRVDFTDGSLLTAYKLAFFSELVANFANEIENNTIRPLLTTTLLNGELAMVGGSGEFFSSHATRLKQRSRAAKTLFFGYCNGHHMYFPTIEATAEGGYGADASVSWVEIGAGERMMDRALINIYTMLGAYGVPGF